MFENVLVGVDGRAGGRDAIALAIRLMRPDGKLTLAHVQGGRRVPSHAVTQGVVTEERVTLHELLEQERAAAEVNAELVDIEASSPGRGLHEQAEKQGADLLVVGSCSRGAFGRTLLGDDTRAALNGTPCAVAIASLGYAEHTKPLTKIGVGYNCSPESEAALQLARELAVPTRASVEALEVVSLPAYGYGGLFASPVDDNLETMVNEANARLKELPHVEGRAVWGLTGEELALFSGRVDLLVVGSRSYGPLKRLLLGSTSNYLERNARCCLLVLPRASLTNDAAQTAEADEAPVGSSV